MRQSQVALTATFILFPVGFSYRNACAAEWKDKAETERKLVFYTTANTAVTKALTDGFKKIYPKVDVQFERTTDSQMMAKFSSRRGRENRSGTLSRRCASHSET